MTQTAILAPGTTGATSTDVVVAAGSNASIGAYVASGQLPMGSFLQVYMDTPGADTLIGSIGLGLPPQVVSGPGTYRVQRQPCASAIGAYSET